MLSEEREKVWENLKRIIESQTYNFSSQKAWLEVIEYIEDENASMPAYSTHFEEYTIRYFFDYLDLSKWTKRDQRAFRFFVFVWNFTLKSQRGYLGINNFLDSAGSALMKEENPKLLEFILQLYEKNGITHSDLWHYCYSHYTLMRGESVKNYIVQEAEKYLKTAKKPLERSEYLLKALIEVNSPLIDKYLSVFVGFPYQGELTGGSNISLLLAFDYDKYEPFVLETLSKTKKENDLFVIHEALLETNSEKYEVQKLDFAYAFFEALKKNNAKRPLEYFIWSLSQKSLVNSYLDDLFHYEDKEKTLSFLKDYVLYFQPLLSIEIQDTLVQNLEKEAIPFLIRVLSSPFDNWHKIVFQNALNHLTSLASPSDLEPIWKYTRDKSRPYRSLIARSLAKALGDNAIPNAMELLADKKGDIRQIGALILSVINSEQAQTILVQTLEKEDNDDARDAMLEGLTSLLATQISKADIEEKAIKAEQRGKLNNAIPSWIVQGDLPPLFWKDNSEKIDSQIIKYLFYRMSRTKDIRFDVEAKPLFALIDKEKSADFALYILKMYLRDSADAKLKYILTIAASLGDEKVITTLQKQVTDWVENSRGKMAEYAVKAIALNGSNKAMRAVEFYTRKYKSKQKNIGAAAEEAFVLAAEELGLSLYELADSIIPDFGFTGLFKEFEVNGASFRAFIDNNFKIAILDEDNDLLKKLPKGTPSDLEAEFKELGKEIKDIVKSQSSRLEQYLIIQRKWNGQHWVDFFLQKPVMFAYATSLIWGIYDKNGTLLSCFQVMEDQCLTNIDGDEFELEPDSIIGIVHPLSLSSEELNHWKSALDSVNIKPIFPQLERSFTDKTTKHLTARSISDYVGVKIGGYVFVSRMEKTGWRRGSVQDAGGIASFNKDFSEVGITAILIQQGMIGVGYYEEDAELGKLYFVKYNSVKTGSYCYDEPNNDEDIRIIPIVEIPTIVYSEVIADLEYLKSISKVNENVL
jgi:hypothetical protein